MTDTCVLERSHHHYDAKDNRHQQGKEPRVQSRLELV